MVDDPPDGPDAGLRRQARGSARLRQASHELVGELAEQAFAALDAGRAEGEDLDERDLDEHGVGRDVSHQRRDSGVHRRQAAGPLRGPRRAHHGFQAQAIERVQKALLAALEELVESRFGDPGLARDPCRG